MEKKTPLYETHLKYHGKMIPFAGYLLPVQYSGIAKEHRSVREQAGLFDVSHMGEILCCGEKAIDYLNYLLTNDFMNMSIHSCRYSPMCNEWGGVVDDLIVYKLSQDEYMLVVNAANKDKDYAWMKQHLIEQVELLDVSDKISQLAIQGPKAYEILSQISEELPEKYYTFVETEIEGKKALISKTGYTGELGYEIYIENETVVDLWEKLLSLSSDLIPCGLASRDTLRLEAAMPLYGHEMNEEITPLETQLNFAVKLNKEDFIGKKALQEKKLTKTRVGLIAIDRGILRENMPIYVQDKLIGKTTSGTFSFTLEQSIAMALIDLEHAKIGNQVEVEVRQKRIRCEIVKLPFYHK